MTNPKLVQPSSQRMVVTVHDLQTVEKGQDPSSVILVAHVTFSFDLSNYIEIILWSF